MATTTKNARITKVFVGFDDHGIPTCMLSLDYGGTGQGFGGYDLRFVGHQMFLFELMKTLEVNDLSQLKNLVVRVILIAGSINAIGHILKDQWFDPNNYNGVGRG